MDPRAAEVLEFWFGTPDDTGHLSTRPEWFRKDEAFDARIVQRFGKLIEEALIGGIDDWGAAPLQALPTDRKSVV